MNYIIQLLRGVRRVASILMFGLKSIILKIPASLKAVLIFLVLPGLITVFYSRIEQRRMLLESFYRPINLKYIECEELHAKALWELEKNMRQFAHNGRMLEVNAERDVSELLVFYKNHVFTEYEEVLNRFAKSNSCRRNLIRRYEDAAVMFDLVREFDELYLGHCAALVPLELKTKPLNEHRNGHRNVLLDLEYALSSQDGKDEVFLRKVREQLADYNLWLAFDHSARLINQKNTQIFESKLNEEFNFLMLQQLDQLGTPTIRSLLQSALQLFSFPADKKTLLVKETRQLKNRDLMLACERVSN